MGTHPIFESDFDCLTEMSTNLTDNITPWLTRDIVAYLRQVNIRTISDFCDANCANLTRMTRLPIEHIRASRSLLMALIETRLINGAELFKQKLGTQQIIKNGINGGFRVGHVSAIEFDFEKRNEAHVKLDKMMSALISDDVGYTALGIDTKRDKWFTKSTLVYVM